MGPIKIYNSVKYLLEKGIPSLKQAVQAEEDSKLYKARTRRTKL